MNGGISPPLSFVGAMKIARTPTVSERHIEWHPPSVGAAISRPKTSETELPVEWNKLTLLPFNQAC